ncbi:MAG: hypothetical protein UT33_C0006G0073 [Candidatus Peregrinibacteria bacterium GW2011_GWC2_39_14]|nr:MAG: hypothetical protein UT33_C0006G0073 [Candidatus Peregrinibacteria bacterium GW2011_GWC2_39_14]
MKKITPLIQIVMAFMLIFGVNVANAANLNTQYVLSNQIEAWASDTIAGFQTIIKTSRTEPGKAIFFTIKRPDDSKIILEKETNKNGFAELEFDGLHTRVAGTYSVMAYLGGDEKFGIAHSFKVYPDQVSAVNSKVTVDQQMLKADGSNSAVMKIVLMDKYDNPIVNHQVNVISSRQNDFVQANKKRDYTDANGAVTFTVNSKTSGISVYSVYDATSKVILNKRISVLYTGGKSFIDAIGGNDHSYMYANTFLAQDAGAQVGTENLGSESVYKFKFEDLNTEVEKGAILDFGITAVDSADAPVTAYTGTIHFAVSGDNSSDVQLPEDYTFLDADMGKHTFSKALLFKKSGTYKLGVIDLANTLLTGEFDITVNDKSEDNPTASSLVSIASPASGKYNSNTQVISGVSLPGSDVKVFDNNEEIGKASADAKGKFEFTTPSLIDGKHIIYVAAVNDKGVILGVSGKIEIEIKTTPAEINSIILTPDTGIAMSAPVVITVSTDAGMAKVSAVIAGEVIELAPVEGKDGFYQGSFQSPSKSGKYDIDILVSDSLGSETSYEKQKSFEVGNSSLETPGTIMGLTAMPGNNMVTLSWKIDDVKNISHYLVYFGTDSKSLVNFVKTFNSKTTWYIPKLNNDVKYFFSVSAVNKNGNESELSKVVSSTPTDQPFLTGFPSALDSELLDENLLEESASANHTGPETAVILAISMLGAAVPLLIRKKKR